MASEAESVSADPAEESGQTKSSIRRRLVRMIGWVGVITLALFALSNLWLWSAWGTGTVEAELEKRTGQDWEIGSMSWSPWNGISLYDTQLLQPEELRDQLDQPVMAVKKIRVRPYWRQLARGRVRPQSVEINAPELTVSVEMLAAIASRTVMSKQQNPAPPSKTEPPITKPPKPAPDTATPKTPTPSKANPPKSSPAAPTTKQKHVLHGLPVRLNVTNAQCRVVSVSKQLDIINIKDLNYDHVLLGDDAEGVINVGSIQLPGLAELTDIQQKVVWKHPYLEFEEQTIDLGGVEARTIAQLGLGKNRIGRLPFLIDLAVDRQKINSAQWLEHVAMVVDADSIIARMRLNGMLHQPDSWRADGMVAADHFSVRERHGNHDVAFEEVFLPIVFRQGALRWSGARLISEDISIMGNGTVSLRDGHLSVTRIVASPEAAAVLTRGIRGSHIIDHRSRWWYDLNTPDRLTRDLVVSGPLLEPVIDAGANYADLPLIKVVSTLYQFIRQEMNEAGRELKALPIPQDSTRTTTKP